MFKAEHLATSIARLCCFGPFSINYYAAYVYPLTDTIPLPCVLSHCSAYRTPICKAKRGGFKDTYPEDLLTVVLKAVLDNTKINPSDIGDIVVGTVLGPGSQRANECRMAAFYAGFPETVPVRTVNRQCSSGLQAVADVAAAIKAGFYDIGNCSMLNTMLVLLMCFSLGAELLLSLQTGIGAGLESMSINSIAWEGQVNPKISAFQKAQDCLLPMGITSENVAHRYGVTRQEQDQAAVSSLGTNCFNLIISFFRLRW
jgi:acetyl-CoA acyltransferase 1